MASALYPLLVLLTVLLWRPIVDEFEKRLFDRTYDYVVVGGGTGGLAIAARLSEDPAIRVAVVESGSYYQFTSPVFSTAPAADTFFAGSEMRDSMNPFIDWNFKTTPQQGGNGREIHYAQGKCLGGTSGRNFMIFQRPDRGCLDTWAALVDDESYTFDNLMPHMRKSVAFTPPNVAARPLNASAASNVEVFDANAGPLRVSYTNQAGPFSSYIEAALNELGMPTVDDFNSGTLMGTQYCASTINPENHHRESSQTSYLRSAKGRRNLRVYTFTSAEKILFNEQKEATGVLLSTGRILTATREVILSAGAIKSPQLLMVSGVGPAAHLESHDIPVVADRPGVGQNFSDHVFFTPSYRVDMITATRVANDHLFTLKELLFNFPRGRGALTNPVSDFLGWEKAPRDMIPASAAALLDELPDTWPDIEYIAAPGFVGNFSSLFFGQPKDGYQYASILAALGAPMSKGTVTLASANAADSPIIGPKWLTHPVDQAVAIAAYKRVRQAFASKAMSQLVIGEEYFPGPNVKTDAEILEVIKNTMMTVWHASCTCRMGRRDDPNAVVDSSARVIGVERLRVVDASAFALLPAGHPQAMVYALAEKIAAEIKAGH